jgi:ketosteroid isomerase-like protein
MRYRRWFAAAAILTAAACQKNETPEQANERMRAESESAKAAIEAAIASFAAHFNAGHADSVAMFYAENGSVLPPNMAPVTGRDSIRAWLAGFFGQASGSTLTITVGTVRANGPMAVERGTYVMSGPGMPADTGKYLALWRRTDAGWVMLEDIWNSNLPPAPPPPPSRR